MWATDAACSNVLWREKVPHWERTFWNLLDVSPLLLWEASLQGLSTVLWLSAQWYFPLVLPHGDSEGWMFLGPEKGSWQEQIRISGLGRLIIFGKVSLPFLVQLIPGTLWTTRHCIFMSMTFRGRAKNGVWLFHLTLVWPLALISSEHN